MALGVAGGAGQAAAAPVAPCPGGKALYDSGRFAAAETAYTEALKEPATEACAKAGLKELDANANECATAAALEEAGREAEAQAAYEKALAAKSDSKCAEAGIEAPDEPIWDDPKGTAEDALAWLGLLVAAISVVVLVISLLLLVMTFLPLVRNWWPASRIRAVRVSIEAFDDVVEPARGGALAGLVRSKIESFGSGSRGLRMVDSQAAAEETFLSELGAISEQAKSFSAFIGWIVARYPRRQYQVKGNLQADSGSGPGLTLSLRKRDGIVDAVTLWPQQFQLGPGNNSDASKAGRLQKLGVPAAAWISHVTVTAAGIKPGGAQDALSWALFKTGLEWEKDGKAAKAVDLYEEAIERDPLNWGALAQLGRLENGEKKYEAAIAHLEEALQILEEEKQVQTLPYRRNSDWYRVKYRLASTRANQAYRQRNQLRRRETYLLARRDIDELLRKCWAMLEPLPLEPLFGRNKELRAFLSGTVLFAAYDLKALIELELAGSAGEAEVLRLKSLKRSLRRKKLVSPLTIAETILREKDDPSVFLLLDLACFFHLADNDVRAKELVDRALAKTPADEREPLRSRIAKDPMLAGIPGVASGGRPGSKKAPPPRPWF